MAITKELTHDAQLRGDYLVICVEKTTILDNSKYVSQSKITKRYYPDSDWLSEAAKIKTICNIHFTADVKSAWAALNESDQGIIKQG